MMPNLGSLGIYPPGPVAFRPTLTGGLALSESNTLISDQKSLVKRYLKDVLKNKALIRKSWNENQRINDPSSMRPPVVKLLFSLKT
jgi:hypothetical protein